MADSNLAHLIGFFLAIHRDISSTFKWIVIAISGLTAIGAALLFNGNIVADLTLDGEGTLNPYLALIALSVSILLLAYILIYLVRLIIKLLLRSFKSRLLD